MDFVGKKYKLDHQENFDQYLQAQGVNYLLRKMICLAKSTVELVKDGEEYSFNTISSFKSVSTKFASGVEFDETTMDGRQVKSIITLEGNKMIHEQKGDKPQTIVREFSDTEMVMTVEIGDIKCRRVFKAI